jgi:hypothetical protein
VGNVKRSVFLASYPATHFYNRRAPLLLPTPIDFVEQDPFAVITSPVASGPVQPTPIPISELPVKQFLALVAILITTATVSARRFLFAFATSAQRGLDGAEPAVLILTGAGK